MSNIHCGLIRCTTEYAHEHLTNRGVARAAAEHRPLPGAVVLGLEFENEDGNIHTPGPALVKVTYAVPG